MSLTNAFKVQDQIILGQLQVGTTSFTPSAYVYTLSARDSIETAGDLIVGGQLIGPAGEFIIRSGDSVNNTVRIAGNLQIDGNTTIINSTELTVDDKNITLASGATGLADVDGAGLTVDHVGSQIYYDPYHNNNSGRWVVDPELSTGSISTTGQAQFGSVSITDTPSGSTLQQTFTGQLTTNGYTIDTFPANICSAQYVIHAKDDTYSSSSNLVISVFNNTVNGSIYGDTTTGPPGHHLISGIGAQVSGSYIQLVVHGVSGRVVITGTAQLF